MKLEGKTVLITGAARRIGREIALGVARRGATVLIHYHHSGAEARSLQKEIEALGQAAIPVACDFSSSGKTVFKRIDGMVKEVYREVRRVDVLVNNASIFYPSPLKTVDESDWDDFLTVNLKVPFFLSRAFGLRMKKKGSGKIINLLDWTAKRPHPDYLPYAVSKAGLWTLTEGLARALAPEVQVNGVAPGPILPAAGTTRQREKKVVEKTLLKRYGNPHDIVRTVRYLIEDTDYVTGTVIPVDGGSLIA